MLKRELVWKTKVGKVAGNFGESPFFVSLERFHGGVENA